MIYPPQQLSPTPLPHPPPEADANGVPVDADREASASLPARSGQPLANVTQAEESNWRPMSVQAVAVPATVPSFVALQAGGGQVGSPGAATSSPFNRAVMPGGPTGAAFGIAGVTTPFGQAVDVTTAVVPDGTEITQGIPMEDNGLNKVVRRVIILAAAGATFYVVLFISNLLRGAYNSDSSTDHTNATSLWTALSSLLIELSIPACGYCGALYSNRQLTCCFCSCNLFITIVSIMSFIRLNIRIGEIEGQCDRERNIQQRRTCEVWVSNGAEKYMMLTSTIVIICIGCAAFWFGNTLYNRLSQDFTLTVPPPAPIVGEVVALTGTPVAVAVAGGTAVAAVASTASTATPGTGDDGTVSEATLGDGSTAAAMPTPTVLVGNMEDGQTDEDRGYEAAPPLLPSPQPVVELLHGIPAQGNAARSDNTNANAATLQQGQE